MSARQCSVSKAKALLTEDQCASIDAAIADGSVSGKRTALILRGLGVHGVNAMDVIYHRNGDCKWCAGTSRFAQHHTREIIDEAKALLGTSNDDSCPVLPMLPRSAPSTPVDTTAGMKWAADGTGTLQSQALPADLPENEALTLTLAILGSMVPAGYRARLAEVKLGADWVRLKQGQDALRDPEKMTRRYRWIIEAIPAVDVHAADAASMTAMQDMVRTHKATRVRPGKVEHAGVGTVHAYGDEQLGKSEGGGSVATIERCLDVLDQAVERVHALRSIGDVGTKDPGLLFFGGDAMENVAGNYASQTFGVDLDLSQQFDLAIDLQLKRVMTLAPLYESLTLVAVPCNHGETLRIGGKQVTRPSDNFSIMVARQVMKVLRANARGAYDHVKLYLPALDNDLMVTLDFAGTRMTFGHGHQSKGGTASARTWWDRQAGALSPHGESTVLTLAHNHHAYLEAQSSKTIIGLPSMDGGSAYFRSFSGQESPAGGAMFTVAEGMATAPRFLYSRVNQPATVAAAGNVVSMARAA